jgi:hypothetical protein
MLLGPDGICRDAKAGSLLTYHYLCYASAKNSIAWTTPSAERRITMLHTLLPFSDSRICVQLEQQYFGTFRHCMIRLR